MDPNSLHPNQKLQNICFIKNVITRKNVHIGDYTYYNCDKDPQNFEDECITYHYEEFGDHLSIGKFCSLGENIRFLMNAANHNLNSISAYPFTAILSEEEGMNRKHLSELPHKGDTIIGNDVWIGQNVTILPGVHIGDGAVIGAYSVVAKDVSPCSIVACSPIKMIRKRFSDEEIETLLKIRWWDWDIHKILANLDIILGSDIRRLKELSEK